MNRNHLNKYQMKYIQRNPNNFSSNYLYNKSNNDADLQNRIERSLYPYNKRVQPYTSSTINNISNFYDNSSNYDLIEDFKATLMKTEQLANNLMNKNNIYKSNYNNYKYNSNINLDSKISSDEIDSDDNYNSDDLEENEEESEEDNLIKNENNNNYRIINENNKDDYIIKKNKG